MQTTCEYSEFPAHAALGTQEWPAPGAGGSRSRDVAPCFILRHNPELPARLHLGFAGPPGAPKGGGTGTRKGRPGKPLNPAPLYFSAGMAVFVPTSVNRARRETTFHRAPGPISLPDA